MHRGHFSRVAAAAAARIVRVAAASAQVPDDVSKRVLAASMAPTFAALFYPLLAFGVGGGNWGLALFSSLWPFVGASRVRTETSNLRGAFGA